MKLTIKQKRFADEYIISGNATEAAKLAGYAEKAAYQTGAENLRKPQIKNYIESRIKEIEASKILTIEEAMQITTKIARGEPREIIKYDMDGEPYRVLEYPAYSDINKATEHFYKINGKFIDKQEVQADVRINSPFKDFTTEELKKLIKDG